MNTRTLFLAGFVGMLLLGVAVGAVSTVPASGDVAFETNSGTVVKKTSVNEVRTAPFADSQTVQFDSGTVSGDGPGRVNIGPDLNGSSTRLENITAGSTTITVDPVNKREFAVSGDIDNITMQQGYAVGDGNTDFTYGGSSGTATIELTGLSTRDTVVGVYEPSTGKLLDSARASSNGRVVFDDLPLSTHTVQLVTGSNAPIQDNPSPQGTVSDAPVQLSVDIDDQDFPQDNVTVAFSLDGSTISTQQIKSARTVTTTVSSISGGNHTWSVNATDSFGNSNVKEYQVNLPTNATVFEIADPPNQLNNRQINATFIRPGNSTVINRQSSSGKFSLRGLPVDRPYIVKLEANNVIDRRTTVFSLVEQQKFYLLNSSADTVDAEFRIDDQTGDFGKSSILQVERQINTSTSPANQSEYVVVAGDEIGSRAAFRTTIERGERYRVSIVSGTTGEERQLGSFQLNQSRPVDLTITGLDQGVNGREEQTFGLSTEREVSGSGGSTSKDVRFSYVDPANQTTSLTLVIHEAGEPSNVFASTQASVGALPLGNFTYRDTFTGQAANVTLVANFTVERDSETVNRAVQFGVSDQLLGIPLGDGWTQIFGVGFLVILGGVFSVANARIGALVIPGVALVLNVTGILSGVVTVVSVGLAFAIAVGWNLVVVSGPGGIGS